MKRILLTWGALAPLLLLSQQTYVWNTSSAQWHDPSAWTPQRTGPLPDDILEFSANATVTDMPETDVIGRLRIHNNAAVSISALQPAAISVGESSIPGTHFLVEAGSTLAITGDHAVSFPIAADGTGRVDGHIRVAGSAHRLTAVSPGSLVFGNGASFTADAGFSGNAFGTIHLHSVIFEHGATYISMSTTGATPFGAPTPNAVTVFESGSTYIHRTNTPLPAFAGRTYGNLVIEGNVNFAGIGSARNCTIQNNLHLTSGFFSFKPNIIAPHTGNIIIAGDIICENDTRIDIGNENMTGVVELAGVHQAVGSGGGTGEISILNLVNNNSSTTLFRPLNITGNIHLQQGKLICTDMAPLIFNADATLSSCQHDYSNLAYTHIGCDNSFVEGPVTKQGLSNGSFAFPTGEGNKLRPLLLHGATGDFTVRYIRGDPYLQVGSGMGAGIHHISHLEYWQVSGDGDAEVALTYYDPNSGGVSDMNALRVARYDGTAWQDQGVTGFTGSPGANGAVRSQPVTAFGFFSLASSSDYPNNPLPLDAYLFTAQADGDRVILHWQVDTLVYTKVIVEKLVSGCFIEIFTHVSGETFAYDENLSEENNVYRLKVFGTTGLAYTTGNKSVRVSMRNDIRVYPNPAREKISIKIPSSRSIFELVIVNISGSVVKRVYAGNQTNLEIEILDLPPGVYYLLPGQTRFPIGRFIKFN